MIIAAIVLVVLGILIKHGKMYFLIAGYNTMPQQKKAKYNIEGIATLMRNVMFFMAAVMLVGYFIADWQNNPELEMIFLSLAIMIGLPYLLIKANAKKFKVDSGTFQK